MKVTVFHYLNEPAIGKGAIFPDAYHRVAEFNLPNTTRNSKALDDAFRYTNSIDCAWQHSNIRPSTMTWAIVNPCRSTSVGDVIGIAIEGPFRHKKMHFYRVAMVGFRSLGDRRTARVMTNTLTDAFHIGDLCNDATPEEIDA